MEPLRRAVWRVAAPAVTGPAHPAEACLTEDGTLAAAGYGLYIANSAADLGGLHTPSIQLPPELDHLAVGDIISVSTDGRRVHVLWRNRSRQNSILLTEQCDNHCLMCS